MESRRLLARITKPRPGPNRNDIETGELVLVLLPGGGRQRCHWEDHRAEEVREDGSIVI